MTMRRREWHQWGGFALGLWLAISPWAAGYADIEAATANAVLLGLALALGGHFQAALGASSGDWPMLGTGLWLIAAPFVLGFEGSAVAAATAVSVGCFVAALAVWAIAPIGQDAH